MSTPGRIHVNLFRDNDANEATQESGLGQLLCPSLRSRYFFVLGLLSRVW